MLKIIAMLSIFAMLCCCVFPINQLNSPSTEFVKFAERNTIYNTILSDCFRIGHVELLHVPHYTFLSLCSGVTHKTRFHKDDRPVYLQSCCLLCTEASKQVYRTLSSINYTRMHSRCKCRYFQSFSRVRGVERASHPETYIFKQPDKMDIHLSINGEDYTGKSISRLHILFAQQCTIYIILLCGGAVNSQYP